MKVVVSDTSPVVALHHLGLCDLLREFFETLFIPPAVQAELLTWGISTADFGALFHVVAPRDLALVAKFMGQIDRGESEALAIAIELGAGLVVVDERKATHIAVANGLATVGVIGLLLRAKVEGRIPLVEPLIRRLQVDLNFFLSPELLTKALTLAGERP